MTEQIFNGSKSVSLDQLKKHIKDTYDIAESGNEALLNVLESLKETATTWKVFANTLLKVRPIENMQMILEQDQHEAGREKFCICRQPENGAHMLCCDFCDRWYHYACVGLPKDIKLEKVKYKCIGCAIRDGKFQAISQTTNNDKKSQDDFDSNQIEIETLLLDLFLTKEKLAETDLTFVLNEGENKIPLKLEELAFIKFIQSQIVFWKSQVSTQLQKGV